MDKQLRREREREREKERERKREREKERERVREIGKWNRGKQIEKGDMIGIEGDKERSSNVRTCG